MANYSNSQIEETYSKLSEEEINAFSVPQMSMEIYRQNFNLYNSRSKKFIIFNAIHAEILLLIDLKIVASGIYSGIVIKHDVNKHFRVTEEVYFYNERVRKIFDLYINNKYIKCVSIDWKDVKHEDDIQVEIEEMGDDF